MQSIKYIPASNQSLNASLMTVQTLRAAAATTIITNTVSGVPAFFYATMGTPHTFTDPTTGETITIISEATAVDFAGHTNSGQLVIDAIAPGYTDAGSKVGDIVILRPITEWANNIFNILSAEHLDNGAHGAVTANSVTLNDSTLLGNDNLYASAIINGGCLVAQRIVVPTLSTTYQYGKVDRFAGKATGTAVTAGTIDQNTGTLVAATRGGEVKFAGVTITGTGVIFLRYRMEAKDAQMFKNAAASFGVRVYHDVGSSINATIFVNKANSSDNFSATTAVANSGAIAVPNAASTLIKFENINTGSLGDVSNGLEIEIQLACGAVTTKNFSFGEFQFNKGAKLSTFQPKNIRMETADCQRYYLVVRDPSETYSAFATGFVTGVNFQVATPVTMRTLPTCVSSGAGHRFGGADYSFTSVASTSINPQGVAFIGVSSGAPGNGNVSAVWTATGSFYLDAEL